MRRNEVHYQETDVIAEIVHIPTWHERSSNLRAFIRAVANSEQKVCIPPSLHF
jgi:hypothetical protein